MFDFRPSRREFMATLAVLGFLPEPVSAFTPYPVQFRKNSPHEELLRFVEPGRDAFTSEKAATETEAHLNALVRTGSLPLSPDFRGASPVPFRWTVVAEGVAEAGFDEASKLDASGFGGALRSWLAGLGKVRRAAFFVLPDHRVRFEVVSEDAGRVGYWRQVWKDGRLQEFAPLSETRVTAPEPRFQDATGHMFQGVDSFQQQLLKGNTYWRSRLDLATGIDIYGNNGIAVGDIDNDGRDEIYVCQPGGLPNRLYKRGNDGGLIDVTTQAGVGVLDDTTCALFVDFRNSGLQDLVVLRGAGPLLFVNQGDGTFTHQPDAFRFRTPPQGSFTGMAAADYDRDGRVDLYLCCYVYFQSEDQYRYPVPYHDARNGPPNFLFRNRLDEHGGGWFEDVTAAAGLDDNNDRYSFAPAWCDFDGDGWPDLYVANDFGRSNLYRNREGKFRDQAVELGAQNVGPGMSASWFDANGDGRPDLYVSDMWSAAGQRIVRDAAFEPGKQESAAYDKHTRGNTLFQNRGGRFEQAGASEGVEMGRWAWSADGFDFDNDGSPEIYVAAGMLTNGSEQDLEGFFWRQVVAKSPVLEKPAPEYENGWNAINQLIRQEYSWCGRQPNVLYARPKPAAGQPARFYDFSGVSGLDYAEDSRAFAVTDWDGDGNLDLILKSRMAPQVRMLRNHCGVGKPVIALRLQGTQSNRDAIGARVEVNGRAQWLSAGSGYLSQHSKQLHFALLEAEMLGAETAVVKIVWPSGARQEWTGLKPGFCYSIKEGSQETAARPFATRAPMPPQPSLAANNQPSFAATWLLEPVPLPDRRKGPGFVLLHAGVAPALPPEVPVESVDLSREPADLAAHYSLFRRYLFDLRTGLDLPLWLLVDDQSRAHKIYFGDVAAGQLAADLRTLRQGRGPELALPFAGRYYTEPRRNYFKLGAAFYWAGYPDQAIPYLDEVVKRQPQNWKALYALGQIHFDAGRWQPALRHYERALAAHPEYPAALLGLGETYAKLDDSQAAAKAFNQVLDKDPDNADAANQLGLLLARQNKPDQAKQLFQRAIAAHRDHTGAINNLAVLYVKLGQPKDAIAAFQYGIEVAPDDEQLYLNLGRLYVSLGERDRARETMRRLLDRKPGDETATRALAELEAR